MTLPRPLTLSRWIAPPALALVLYWGGLTAWFQKDDFSWLGLRDMLRSGTSLWWILFAPLAQGTIRTLSERMFYLSLSSVFGLNPLPFRLAAFCTFCAALTLLQLTATRLSRSRSAGWWAAILWTVNGALATPMSWTAVYYQLLCASFFLLDIWLLLRYIDTNDNRYYLAQWGTFLLGFLVLELNVVYPALATLVALGCAPRIVRKILPMFGASILYMALHISIAPLPASGPYRLYWNWHIIPTLLTYVNWSLGAGWLSLVNLHSLTLRIALTLLLASGLGGFLIWKLRNGDWTVLLYPAWFLIVLAPLLPLRFHMSYEYLTVPVIGLAMWGGAAIMCGWRSAGWRRFATMLLVAIYIAVALPVGHAMTAQFHDRGNRIHDLFLRVKALSEAYPNRIVIFRGVNSEIYNDVIYPRAFRLVGIPEVYVVPEEQSRIDLGPVPEVATNFFIDPALERQVIRENRAVVYDLSSGVRDVTSEYKSPSQIAPATRIGSHVEIGDRTYAGQLGPTWYSIEGGYRWMPKQATVMLRGPSRPDEKLYVKGFCPAVILSPGPLRIRVTAGGMTLPLAFISRPDSDFELSFPLSAKLTGKPVVQILLEVDRTFHSPADARELGVPVVSIAIR